MSRLKKVPPKHKLDMWQGAEQEFATGPQPVRMFEALGRRGVFVFRPIENIPRAFLINGGVCYVHSNLFEVCTPECHNALELVTYEKACEAYARLASWVFQEEMGLQNHLYKTSIAFDPTGEVEYTTVGAHENYLVKRKGFTKNLSLLVPYLVLRQILFGAGGYVRGSYLISPRSIFPKEIYSKTSTDYPIVSTRDEPHAEERFFRVHVVNGEGARSEYTTFLKYSLTSYVLRAIQDGYIHSVPELDDPIASSQEIARNLEGDWRVDLANGGSSNVIEYLNSYYIDGIEKVFSEVEAEEHDLMALREIKWALKKLEEGMFEDLDTSLEWVIKMNLIEKGLLDNFQFERGLDETATKETAAFQYTAVTDSLFDDLIEKKNIKKVIPPGEIEKAFMDPPEKSRGEFRVAAANRFQEALDTMSWSHLKLRKGNTFVSYEFPDLDGWNKKVIEKKLLEIDTLFSKE